MADSVENTFWRPEKGLNGRKPVLLRLPTELVELANAQKPNWQSLSSFLGDLIVRGLYESPLDWRFPSQAETNEQKRARALPVAEQVGAGVVLIPAQLNTAEIDLPWITRPMAKALGAEPGSFVAEIQRVPDEETLEW